MLEVVSVLLMLTQCSGTNGEREEMAGRETIVI